MNTENGWVKFYREWLNNPIITKDAEHLAVWTYLHCYATHNETECIFKGEVKKLKAGQMLLKQCDMANSLKIDRFKVMRILKCFENAHLISHTTDKRQTLITLEDWAIYQGLNTQPNAHPLHIQCTSEQETENEKEKRSKREKDKEKEINKNERMKEYLLQQPAVSCQPSEERDFLSKYDKNSCKEISVSEANNSLFNEFWQEYPKKVGKGYAQECFKKIKPTRELVDIMINAIKKQKKSDMWKRDKGQYIPNPSTWLNQKRWEDDLDVDTDETPKLKLKFNGLNGLEF